MALPLLLGLGGSALGGAGLLGGLGALSAGAIGSGLGSYLETGDLGKGIQTGLTSYLGGKALGSLMGGGSDAINAANQANTVGAGTAADPMRIAGTTSAGMGATTAADAATSGLNLAPASTAGGSILSDPTAAMQTPGSLTAGFTGPAMPYTAGALGTTALGSSNLLAPKGLEGMAMPKGGMRPESEAAVYDPRTPGEDYRPGIDPEFEYFDSSLTSLKSGGIASLNYQEGGMVPNDKELISGAVDAIEGKSPSPEVALGAFVARYGEEALRDLVDRVQRGEFQANAMVEEGMVSGIGDGMDDMIPATLEGDQDVVLSDGEFIVPADVVSGLGNGSSDAGSEALYEMMDRVRKLRTGKEEQPEQVPQGDMLPV